MGDSAEPRFQSLDRPRRERYAFDMKAQEKEYRYPLRLPSQDEGPLTQVATASGQSINTVLVLCVRKGLPLVREILCPNQGRVTVVDPLPESVLERIYENSDELEGVTSEQLQNFQSQTEPE